MFHDSPSEFSNTPFLNKGLLFLVQDVLMST